MITQTLLNLVKSFEGCKLTAYQDQVGVWTIGYGATGPGIERGVTWTQEQADNRLQADLERFQEGVKRLLKVAVSQNEQDALTDFAYNLGLGSLGQSTLLRCINMGHKDEAPGEFLRWDKAGGVSVPGLLRRRQAEATLFSSRTR